MDRRNLLEEPFRTAFDSGDSIDYKLVPDKSDHAYVEKRGFTPEMHSDCSYSAKGLKGLSLASYGEWGTAFTGDFDATSEKLFLDMIELGIIKPWRIRAYRKGRCYDYNSDKFGWTMYSDEAKKWIAVESPYTNDYEN